MWWKRRQKEVPWSVAGDVFIRRIQKSFGNPKALAKALQRFANEHRMMGLTDAAAVDSLRLAGEDLPTIDDPIWRTSWHACEKLVRVAFLTTTDAALQAIAETFRRYDTAGKRAALDHVARCVQPEAAHLFLTLLDDLRDEPFESFPSGDLLDKALHADLILPGIMKHSRDGRWERIVLDMLLRYQQQGVVSPALQQQLAPDVLAIWREFRPKVFAAQQEVVSPKWLYHPPNSEIRYRAGLLIDVLGGFESAEIQGELLSLLALRDPRPRWFAVKHLLQRGIAVESEVLDEIAASDELRGDVVDELEKLGKLALIDAKYLSAESLATAGMVFWLSHFMELGTVPDAIELMETISTPNCPDPCYVFRFRSDIETYFEKGWMASVYHQGNGSTCFAPWDFASPRDHMANCLRRASERDGDVIVLSDPWFD